MLRVIRVGTVLECSQLSAIKQHLTQKCLAVFGTAHCLKPGETTPMRAIVPYTNHIVL